MAVVTKETAMRADPVRMPEKQPTSSDDIPWPGCPCNWCLRSSSLAIMIVLFHLVLRTP